MINVGLQTRFTVSGTGRDQLRVHVQAVMDHLLALEQSSGALVHSSAVAVDLGTAEVTIELVGVGETFDQAETAANGAVRTAVHVAGGHTPGWRDNEQPRFEQRDSRAQLIDAS